MDKEGYCDNAFSPKPGVRPMMPGAKSGLGWRLTATSGKQSKEIAAET